MWRVLRDSLHPLHILACLIPLRQRNPVEIPDFHKPGPEQPSIIHCVLASSAGYGVKRLSTTDHPAWILRGLI